MSHGVTASMLLSSLPFTTLFFLKCIVALQNKKGYPLQTQAPSKGFPKGPDTWESYSSYIHQHQGANAAIPTPKGNIFRVATVNADPNSPSFKKGLEQFQKDLGVFKPRILVSTGLTSGSADETSHLGQLEKAGLKSVQKADSIAINSDLPLKLMAKPTWKDTDSGETNTLLALSVDEKIGFIGAKLTSSCDKLSMVIKLVSIKHKKVIVAGDLRGIWKDDSSCVQLRGMLFDSFKEVGAASPSFTGLWRERDMVMVSSDLKDATMGAFMYYTDAFNGMPVMTDFDLAMFSPSTTAAPPSGGTPSKPPSKDTPGKTTPTTPAKLPPKFTPSTTDQPPQEMTYLKWGVVALVAITVIMVLIFLARR